MSLSPAQRYARESVSTIDSIFNLLDFKQSRASSGTIEKRIPMRAFRDSLLISPDTFGDLGGDDLFYVAPDVLDLWPIHTRSWVFQGDGGYTMSRLETPKLRDMKGKVTRVMPRMLRWQMITSDDGQPGYGYETWLGVKPDNSLVRLDVNPMKPIGEDETYQVYLVASTQLYAEYVWTVTIGKIGSDFRFKVATDSVGARRLLSLRDVPDGRQRRAALRHWVSEHTRRIRRPEGEYETDVVTHLRGATPFTWDEFEGVVTPSPFDLRRAEEARRK